MNDQFPTPRKPNPEVPYIVSRNVCDKIEDSAPWYGFAGPRSCETSRDALNNFLALVVLICCAGRIVKVRPTPLLRVLFLVVPSDKKGDKQPFVRARTTQEVRERWRNRSIEHAKTSRTPSLKKTPMPYSPASTLLPRR